MKKCLLFFPLLLAALPASTQDAPYTYPCEECDFIVGAFPIDGDQLQVKPGDVICLSSDRVYERITFKNLLGTPEEPIIIRNCGGKARIYSTQAFGVKFQHSAFFKLTGEGGSDSFGIEISTEKGFYLTMEGFTTNFEISHLEIAGPTAPGMEGRSGFAGIGVKTSPYENCELFGDPTREAWILRDIRIHHNYIHDTGGEGLYIGHGFYKGQVDIKCPGLGERYSHAIKGVRIYENLIENTGYDGIQIKNADEDVKVYHNIIRNYGTKCNPIHNEGLFIGEGTTGEFYGNMIDSGTGNGLQIQGIGNLNIHNNVIHRAGENGIYASHGSYVVRWPDGFFDIHHNVITYAQKDGFVFYNKDGGLKKFSQNMILYAGGQATKGGPVEYDENYFSNDSGSDEITSPTLFFINHSGISDACILSKIKSYTWFVPPGME